MRFTIEDLRSTDDERIDDAAALLHAAFSPLGVWTTMAEAREEVVVSISHEKISRVDAGSRDHPQRSWRTHVVGRQ
jgi:hypothetical protein